MEARTCDTIGKQEIDAAAELTREIIKSTRTSTKALTNGTRGVERA